MPFCASGVCRGGAAHWAHEWDGVSVLYRMGRDAEEIG